MSKLPDYSNLNSKSLALTSVKTSVHRHGLHGPWHLEIDCMIDPSGESVVEKIREGFDRVLSELAVNGEPIDKQEWHGDGPEARQANAMSIEDYHNAFERDRSRQN
jgi:hypothetical protein